MLHFQIFKKKMMAKTTRLKKSSFLNLHETRRCQKLSGYYLLKPLSASVALIQKSLSASVALIQKPLSASVALIQKPLSASVALIQKPGFYMRTTLALNRLNSIIEAMRRIMAQALRN